jgi:hypothetical protein
MIGFIRNRIDWVELKSLYWSHSMRVIPDLIQSPFSADLLTTEKRSSASFVPECGLDLVEGVGSGVGGNEIGGFEPIIGGVLFTEK